MSTLRRRGLLTHRSRLQHVGLSEKKGIKSSPCRRSTRRLLAPELYKGVLSPVLHLFLNMPDRQLAVLYHRNCCPALFPTLISHRNELPDQRADLPG